MIKLFLVFLLSLNIYANNILEIKDDFVSYNSSNFIYYTQDINHKLKSSDILKSNDLALADITHLGIIKGPFWTKLALKNTSSITQEIIIYNPFANIGELDIYIYKDTKLIKTILLGDLREQKTERYLVDFKHLNIIY